MVVNQAAHHIVVLRRGQFCTYAACFFRRCLNNLVRPDWFDVLDDENRPLLTEREVLRNLQAIVQDADKTPITEVRVSYFTFVARLNRRPGGPHLYRRSHDGEPKDLVSVAPSTCGGPNKRRLLESYRRCVVRRLSRRRRSCA